MDGRKEMRSPTDSEVLLSTGAQPISSEIASTENTSSYGVRVRTRQPWKTDTSILVKLPRKKWLRARVVYCHQLRNKSFALGIQFLHTQT